MTVRYRAEVYDNVKALVKAGFILRRVDYDRGYGTEEGVDVATTSTVQEAVEAILAVEQSWLYVETAGSGVDNEVLQEVWVCFVLGNEAGVAVNDWLIPTNKNQAILLDHTLTLVSNEWQDMEETRRLAT